MMGDFGQNRHAPEDPEHLEMILREDEEDLKSALGENQDYSLKTYEVLFDETDLERKIDALIGKYTAEKERIRREVRIEVSFSRLIRAFRRGKEKEDSGAKDDLRKKLKKINEILDLLYAALDTEQGVDGLAKQKNRGNKINEGDLDKLLERKKEQLRQLSAEYGIVLEE